MNDGIEMKNSEVKKKRGRPKSGIGLEIGRASCRERV